MSSHPCHTRNHDCTGFTLIELIVVIVVLAIVAAVAAPMIGNTDGHRLRGAIDMFAADFRYAQSEAMSHSDQHRALDFRIANGTGYDLVNTDVPGNPSTAQTLPHPIEKAPYSVNFGQARARAYKGVWLAKSNLNVTNHGGHIDLGPYGNVEVPSVNPRLIFAINEKTLGLTIDRDTGNITIDADFQSRSTLAAQAVSGPNGTVSTIAQSPY